MDKLQAIAIDVNEVKTRDLHADYEYTEKDRAKDLTKVYVRSAVELGKIYGPTVLLGSASVICVISAHNMMLKRQASLVAAYTALSASYEAYRRRVAEKIGPDEEKELYREVKFIQSIAEDGEACEIIDFSDEMPSVYAVFFDESSANWKPTAEYNKFFLREQQNYFNNRLHAYGFVFLNEVLEAIGLPRTQAGQIVGWRLPDPKCRKCHIDQKCENCSGDGFIDFGMYDIFDSTKRAFVNGHENVILLDFNVQGPIFKQGGHPRARI